MDDYEGLRDGLEASRTFLIASHYSPDGDGIGSTVAMALALEQLGKQVVLYNQDLVPDNLRFLPEVDRFVRKIPGEGTFDMAIMVDCAERSRISPEFAACKRFTKVACIDHHLLESVQADLCLLDGGAASTGEVVLRFMKRAGLVVTPEIAQCIYTTLVVDTGFFKYSSTNAHVLGLASELVQHGASPWTVAKHLEESYPPSRLMLLAHALATLRFELGGRYATMEVSQRMLAETGATLDYSDEFATYPRSVAGVEVAALFREIAEGAIKVSLRSKDLVDVAALAHDLGGGGHSRAAGVRIRASMAEAKAKIFEAVEQALKAEKGRS